MLQPDRLPHARGGRADDGHRLVHHLPHDQGGGPVTDSLALVAGGLIVLTGMALVAVALRWKESTAIEDLLAEFEGTSADLDSYTQHAADAGSLQRLLVPLGRNLIGSMQNLLPRNHVANIRRRLVLAGISGRMGAEEYIAGQVVGTCVGILLGLLLGFATDGRARASWPLPPAAGCWASSRPSLYVKQNRDVRVEAIEKELPGRPRRPRDLRRGRGRARGRHPGRHRTVPVPAGRRARPHALGDGARPVPSVRRCRTCGPARTSPTSTGSSSPCCRPTRSACP